MSFVVAAPEQVQAAAHDLAGIRSMLAEASSSVAFPTTAVVPAAADEVSAAIATLFGNFGQQYQLLSAQARAFHTEFVDLLNAGAGAYLGTEIANAEQNLLNAINGPVQGLLGMSGGAAAAQPAALPILGGGTSSIGSILGGLGGGTPISQSLGGVVTALQNGNAVSLLSGQIGTGLQTLSRDITGLTGLGNTLAPGLLQTGASATGLADIAGPYQTLFTNTATNLQTLGDVWLANPLPFLHQFITNQIGYAETLAAGVEYVIQNLPAVLANLPANIQAAIQALLAFDPVPYIQQFINHQIAYAQLIGMSLQNAAHSFGTGLQALPAAFQSAFPRGSHLITLIPASAIIGRSP
jgi:PE family